MIAQRHIDLIKGLSNALVHHGELPAMFADVIEALEHVKQTEQVFKPAFAFEIHTIPTDDEIRIEWRKAGGAIHGPNVETVTMAEENYFALRRLLAENCLSAKPIHAAKPRLHILDCSTCHGDPEQCDKHDCGDMHRSGAPESTHASDALYVDAIMASIDRYAHVFSFVGDDSLQRQRQELNKQITQIVMRNERLMREMDGIERDLNRLVRALDVIINGEKGVAPQARLCDIVTQMRREYVPVLWSAEIRDDYTRYTQNSDEAMDMAKEGFEITAYTKVRS